MKKLTLKSNIIDIHTRSIYYGSIVVNNGVVDSIEKLGDVVVGEPYVAPGLIDSHVHIESSMVTPSRFAELIVPHGTIAALCDPHEIANVLGRKGVEYMMDNAATSPLKLFFGVPSCVPATSFETSGGIIDVDDIEYLFEKGAIFLAEMMNYPGVIYDNPMVWSKIRTAKKWNKPIDGHAPGLVGDDLVKYIKAGITTDHECSNIDEALQRIAQGMFVQIREGSAARNFNNLYSLIQSYPHNVMLCTDDSHPDDICEKGHIDKIVRMALAKGISIFDIYQAALINSVRHYNLPVGTLKVGDKADFIVIDNPNDFNVLSTYIDGVAVFDNGDLNINIVDAGLLNNFIENHVYIDDLIFRTNLANPTVKVIDVKAGELLTATHLWNPTVNKGVIDGSVDDDIAKIVVVNRYQKAKPAIGFIRGLGVKSGAFGATIAHDSHNVVIVGVDDVSIMNVIEQLFKQKGGICCYNNGKSIILPLPIAGLMSDKSGREVANLYSELNDFATSECGVTIQSPFMTLSFMSLLVIPSLKLGDRGLFDVDKFEFTDLVY